MAKLLGGTIVYGTGTVQTILYVQGTTNSTGTTTGALQVVGGAGIGRDLWVGGTIYGVFSGSVTGTATTATNIAGGSAGSIPIQSAPGVTTFINTGSVGNLLQQQSANISTFVSTSTLQVGYSIYANTATNVAGGTPGQLHYQSGVGATSFVSTGSVGQLLMSSGTSAPLYVNTASVVVGNAANIASGYAGLIPIQSGVGTTAFINTGSVGYLLQWQVGNTATWVSTSSILATSANNISGGLSGQLLYQTSPGQTGFVSTGTAGNVLVSNGSSSPTYNNTLTLAGTGAALSTNSGAFQVAGGAGIGGDVFLGGNFIQVGGTYGTLATTYNLINTTATTVNFAGAATTLTMGASASGTTTVRNNLTVAGNLTIQGTTTIVDSTVTNIADPIITLGGGAGNTAPSTDDNKDRGIAFKWYTGSAARTGFFGYQDSTGFFTFITSASIVNEVVALDGGSSKGALDAYLAGGTAQSLVYQSSPNITSYLAAGTAGYILQTNGTGSAPSWVSTGSLVASNAISVQTVLTATNATFYPSFVSTNNSTPAALFHYTTSSFVINPYTGNVGIGVGTTAPAGKLDVAGDVISQSYVNAQGSYYFQAKKARGTISAPTVVLSGDTLGGTIGGGYDGTSYQYTGAVQFRVDGAVSAGVVPIAIQFMTGATSGYTERMRIDASGRVSIGANAASTWSTTYSVLELNNHGTIYGGSASLGLASNMFYDGANWQVKTVNSSTLVALNSGPGNVIFYRAASGAVGSTAALLESMRIDIGGNVGIGTATPATKFAVAGGIAGTAGLNISGNGWGVLPYVANSVVIDNNTGESRFFATGGDASTHGKHVFYTGTTNGTALERMRITSNGGISFGASGTAYGTSGYILKSNGDAAPTWVDPATVAAASATNADNLKTVATSTNASYYPSFVDSNNAVAGYEAHYTTSSFSINPSNGVVTLASTAAATSTSTGALRVNGGAGIGGDIYAGGNLYVGGSNANAQVAFSNQTVYGPAPVVAGTNLFIFGGSNQNGVGAPNILIQSTANGNPYNPQIQMVSQQDGGAFGPLGVINFMGFVSGKNQSGSAIIGYSPTSGGTTVPGGLRFYTNNGATTTTTLPITTLSLQIDQNSNATFYSTSATVSPTTGALIVTGGVGIGGTLYVGALRADATTSATTFSIFYNPVTKELTTATSGLAAGTSTTSSQLQTVGIATNASYYPSFVDSNNATAIGELYYTTSTFSINPSTGVVSLTSTAAATSTSTGALRVTGGVGIQGDLYAKDIYTNGVKAIPLNIQEFTAGATQTTFTVTGGYTVGTVQVFANGINLGSGDFTASNGTTVILNQARNLGDIIRIISGGISSSINNIQSFSIAMSIAMSM